MDKNNWLIPPNEWQFIDPTNGFIFPWLTLDFLEHLMTFDMSRWRIFEAGGGAGTLWWANKCKEIVTLETDKDWLDKICDFAKRKGLYNIDYNLVEPNLYQNPVKAYLDILEKQQHKFDLLLIDGIYRNQLATIAEPHIKDGGLLVVDNYLQEEVRSIMDYAEVLNSKYSIKIFKHSPILNPEEHP